MDSVKSDRCSFSLARSRRSRWKEKHLAANIEPENGVITSHGSTVDRESKKEA